MSCALVGLGSNLGNRSQNLDRAVRLLAQMPGVHFVHESAWRSTRAVGGPKNQADFLNGAVLIETSLSPQQLLAKLAEIEALLGRTRHVRWSPRTIDLDLLLFDARVLHTPGLDLPHPRMSFRRFVLQAAADVAPEMVHPECGMTIGELLAHLNQSAPYVAIRGKHRKRNQALAMNVAAQTGWQVVDLPANLQPLGGETSAGPAKEPAIEFVDGFLPLTERGRWPGDVVGIVTPFWIGEFGFEHQSITPPRLLVCYDDASTCMSDAAGMRISGLAGPKLRLNIEEASSAQVELVAAIQAMS